MTAESDIAPATPGMRAGDVETDGVRELHPVSGIAGMKATGDFRPVRLPADLEPEPIEMNAAADAEAEALLHEPPDDADTDDVATDGGIGDPGGDPDGEPDSDSPQPEHDPPPDTGHEHSLPPVYDAEQPAGNANVADAEQTDEGKGSAPTGVSGGPAPA